MDQIGKSVTSCKETCNLTYEETLGKKKVILAALAKASEANPFPKETADTFISAPHYFTLSSVEMTPLVRGDLETIEVWISRLDRNHPTQPLHCRINES